MVHVRKYMRRSTSPFLDRPERKVRIKPTTLEIAAECPQGHESCGWEEWYFTCPWCESIQSDKDQHAEGALSEGMKVRCTDCGRLVKLV